MTPLTPGLLLRARNRVADLWRVVDVSAVQTGVSVTLRPATLGPWRAPGTQPKSTVPAAALGLHYEPARVECACGRAKPGPKRGKATWGVCAVSEGGGVSWGTAIDLFAGAGGFTEAARRVGLRVLWAANHWQAAVDVHAVNHPDVTHACQDLHQANWSTVPAHDVLLASPCCQGHTRARGKDRPHHDSSRSTAWAVVSAAEFHRPSVVVVENVPEFRGWALYPAWRMAMNALGYALGEHIVNAADCGVPQSRERLFVVGTRSTVPVDLGRPDRPHRAAREVVDFGAGQWRPIVAPGRSPKTLARVDAGRRRHGDRFLVAYYGSERGGRSLDAPLGTVTTRDRHAVVDGDRMRMLSADEARRAMDFPAGYRLPARHKDAMRMLGNAVAPGQGAWVLDRVREAA